MEYVTLTKEKPSEPTKTDIRKSVKLSRLFRKLTIRIARLLRKAHPAVLKVVAQNAMVLFVAVALDATHEADNVPIEQIATESLIPNVRQEFERQLAQMKLDAKEEK